MNKIEEKDKRIPLGARVLPETKQSLQELAALISKEIQTRISLSQALEIAIKEALKRRSSEVLS